MRSFVFCLFVCLFASCSTILSKKSPSFENMMELSPGQSSKKEVLARFGKPDEKDFLPRKEIQSKEPLEFWAFKKGKAIRFHMTFLKNKLQSMAYDIYEEDPEFNLKFLLDKVDGQFQVIKEPVRNPHAMPSKCYLVDEKKGVSILVGSYKKAPSFVSFWNPSLGKKKKWFDDSTPEFCIAGYCSRVTDPDAWEYNHCEWLEKMVAKKGRLRNKPHLQRNH